MTVGRLVDGLRSRGHAVSVLRPGSMRGWGNTEDIFFSGIPLPGYPGLRLGLPAGGRLRNRWRDTGPDLVHVVTEGPLGWSAVVAPASGNSSDVRVSYQFRSLQHTRSRWLRPLVAAYLPDCTDAPAQPWFPSALAKP